MGKILIIETFYGGSHKKMIDVLQTALQNEDYTLLTMSAKKWPWRARCGALYISQLIPDLTDYDTLFCSSVLNLSELIGLCPAITKLRKIVYFHENQLNYPIQTIKERDCQYGYNQITSCLAADIVLFNSDFNKVSFLSNIKKFIKLLPDYRPKNIREKIEAKSSVLYFPVDFKMIDELKTLNNYNDVKSNDGSRKVHIVWPHRWEFDKNPKLFFDVLYRLIEENVYFQVSVLGESFSEVPPEITEARTKLEKQIKHFGFVESVQQYYSILLSADVIVSTANHEFFGVSMLEGVRCGCLPLAPNTLVYPELYPRECLYDTPEQLFYKLKVWCTDPLQLINLKDNLKIETEKYNSAHLLPHYIALLKNNL